MQCEYLGIYATKSYTVESGEIYVGVVEFNKKYPHYGFDDTVTPHWISIGVGEWKTHTEAIITPQDTASEVDFNSNNTGIAMVSPSTASASPQNITANGVGIGETAFLAKIDDTEFNRLNVAVYGTQTVKVSCWLIKDINGDWPSNVPSASTLQNGLEDIYKEQAYVTFDVNINSKIVDYDLDDDGVLDSSGVITPGEEEQAIIDTAYDSTADINIYYVVDYAIDNAATRPPTRIIFIQDFHENLTINVTAHEIGHSLQLLYDLYEDSYNDRLMYGYGISSNPSELIKNEWDTINSTACSF